MKTRNGFVSNSSSSSFIIGLYKEAKPVKLEEVKAKLAAVEEMLKKVDPDRAKDWHYSITEYTGAEALKHYKGWISVYPELEKISKAKKYIVIEDDEDNSTPSVLFELIEESFAATRLHLG